MKFTPQIFDVIERHVVFTFDAAQVQAILRDAAIQQLGAEVDAAKSRITTVIDMKGPAVVEVVQALTVDPAQLKALPPAAAGDEPVPEPIAADPAPVEPEPQPEAPEPVAKVDPPPADILRHLRKMKTLDNWVAEDDLALVEWRMGNGSVREFADKNGRTMTFINRRLEVLISGPARMFTYAQLIEALRYITEGNGA